MSHSAIVVLSSPTRHLVEVAAITKSHPEALIVMADRFLLTHRGRIVEFAAQRRIPAMFAYAEFVEAGGLMSYAPSNRELFRRAAIYVDISKHAGRVNDESILVDEIAA